jgi:amino acid permease
VFGECNISSETRQKISCYGGWTQANRFYYIAGTGLFVGSGSALATGGPAALVISYCTLGIMLFCTVHALGEMAVLFPVAGSFSAYSSRFLDPAWGGAMGWK